MSAGVAGQWLARFANLHLAISNSTPVIVENAQQPWVSMFVDIGLSADWRDLMIRHPHQFLFAVNARNALDWTEFYFPQVDVWRAAVLDLPEQVARAFAHGNTEHLWRSSPP